MSLSPSSSRELVMGLDYSRADTKRAREGYMEPRVRNVAIANAMAHRSHGHHRSGSSTKRYRPSEGGEAVHHHSSSHRSSRELDSVLAQASVSSRGTSQDLALRPRRARTHQLPSPPPEDFPYRHGQVEPVPRAIGTQTSRDLQGFGAWCDPIASPQQQVFAGSPYSYEDAPQSTRSRRDSISIAPSTPRDRLLPMPELSPMPTHFVFCPCCVDEEDRINETWHMAGPEKMDTQRRLPLMDSRVSRSATCNRFQSSVSWNDMVPQTLGIIIQSS
ncbi:hypothetical protein BBK36DRAFT_1197598 [Trichoderma citrinoviride]|uniref:Uncharacterized protein n=1 Tax=Trichoderma citrinoviride TaxID=58853 RepID=A0A2T4BED5_9HYPO|nr:hypothetical protein BBK36DRAFT_1197598 [Trichoderma citrinoviride]PTB67694.1 hypothetical protein BBK36DRAFT_1197598 [Trichoderma citrinoviride]